MRRRDLIALFGGGLVAGFSGDWPVASRAQQSSMAKVGLLWPGPAPPVSPRLESFRDGLQRSGYIEGQNIAFELRYGAAVPQQLADQAAELVRAKVDVIATFGDSATKIAQDATGTIPIVALGDDLLGSGLIGSLSRPGGNTTGISILLRNSAPSDWNCCRPLCSDCRVLLGYGIHQPNLLKSVCRRTPRAP